MKRFNFFRMIVFVASLATMFMFSACDDPTTPPEEPVEIAWQVLVDTVTDSSIGVTVTPSDLKVPYYVAIHTAEEVGEDKGVALSETLIAAEDFASKLVMGKKKISAEELTPATDYFVVAFAYDTLKKEVLADVFVSEKITTKAEAGPAFPETITLALVEGSATWRNAVVNVSVSKEGLKYICGIEEKEEWEAKYAANTEQIVAEAIEGWKKDLENNLYPDNKTWQEYMVPYQMETVGDVDMAKIRNLHWNTEYVFYCYGMNAEGEQTTPVVFQAFATIQPEASDNVITITIDETTKTSVNFTINTTNEDPYFVSIQRVDYLARFEGEESYDEMIWDLVSLKTDDELAVNVFNGSRAFTNQDINKSVNGFKEYKVVVWGFGEGPTTQPIFSETFKPGTTHVPADPFELAIENISWCGADVKVTPLSATDTYIIAGMAKVDFEAMDSEALYAKNKANWESLAESYSKTWQEVMLESYAKTGAFEGTANDIIGKARLQWGADYVVYCFGVNAEGEMTTKVFSTEFKTLAPVASATTFAISIDAMTRSSVEFTIEPSDNNTPYYVTIEQTTLVDNYGPDKDKSYDDMIAYLLPDNDTQLESRIFTGKQTLTQASVGKSVNGFKNYYIVVWGFENGPTTSVTLSESFKPANPE